MDLTAALRVHGPIRQEIEQLGRRFEELTPKPKPPPYKPSPTVRAQVRQREEWVTNTTMYLNWPDGNGFHLAERCASVYQGRLRDQLRDMGLLEL